MSLLHRIPQAIQEIKEESSIVKDNYGGGRLNIALDMIGCLFKYGARPIDYTRFQFYKKSAKERNRYLTIFRYFKLYKKMKSQISVSISGDKVGEYKFYKDFIKRKWMVVDHNTPVDEIMTFIKSYHCIIAKPNRGEQGKGVMKIHETDKLSRKTG